MLSSKNNPNVFENLTKPADELIKNLSIRLEEQANLLTPTTQAITLIVAPNHDINIYGSVTLCATIPTGTMLCKRFGCPVSAMRSEIYHKPLDYYRYSDLACDAINEGIAQIKAPKFAEHMQKVLNVAMLNNYWFYDIV